MMQSPSLNEYFAMLGSQSSLCGADCILVDDNARIAHPVKENSGHRRLRKMSRWDSAGCLPRLACQERSDALNSPFDTSPSFLRYRKPASVSADANVPPLPSVFRKSKSDERIAMSSSSASLDKPLKHPLRLETPLAVRNKGSLKRHHSCTNVQNLDDLRSSPLRNNLLRQLPYEMPVAPLSPESDSSDSMDNFDLVKALDEFDWEEDAPPTIDSPLTSLDTPSFSSSSTAKSKRSDADLLATIPKRSSPTQPPCVRVSYSVLARTA